MRSGRTVRASSGTRTVRQPRRRQPPAYKTRDNTSQGKQACELGASCPYKHEYQHQLEFSHPPPGTVLGAHAPAANAGASQRSFQGRGQSLGGAPGPARGVSSGRVATAPGPARGVSSGRVAGVQKRQPPARAAAAAAALARFQAATPSTSASTAHAESTRRHGTQAAGTPSHLKGNATQKHHSVARQPAGRLNDEVIDLTALD
eukprot:CAMPEP_0117691918 /NCGR_PEP_ID=MMETSP0804-20121206/26016_1 /TAXON_ID=1074897 /ORGANISM="Tetraselmis astigmatica, Strain CCMP880" /LENGTH=203 /DNA_ID=CAMNT_0005505263 /DNA_START=274 /DNA_END=885 /DNA_ORIENTATION=-